jgi:hypothetical protein
MHSVLAVRIGFKEISHRAEAGVIDQQAKVSRIANSLRHTVQVGVAREISGQDFRVTQFRGECAKTILATRDQKRS